MDAMIFCVACSMVTTSHISPWTQQADREKSGAIDL
jgi:hypothetical protein